MTLGRLGATRTAIVMALEAVFGVILTAIFLDESVKLVVAIGGVAVLTGAVLAALAAPQRDRDERSGLSPVGRGLLTVHRSRVSFAC